jgi:hypothetical protein
MRWVRWLARTAGCFKPCTVIWIDRVWYFRVPPIVMSNDTDFSRAIKGLLIQLRVASSPDPHGLRTIAGRLQALPVYCDMGGCYCIRPSGEVVSFAWETPHAVQVETNPLIRNLALCQGSKKYATLRKFIPARPSNASDCPDCEGKGELPAPVSNCVCRCGGFGWIPADAVCS